ncbi:MAG: lactate permease LctP family transporter [Ginsengibacter sp.]
MYWSQVTNPFGNLLLSVFVALLPILFIFWALIIKKMEGYKASLYATLIAVIVAIFIYSMPVKLSILSVASGALYGLFPICWIIIAALFLFNITVKSGQFEIIKHHMASITSDRRLQALLIAFSFGAFLEGTAGFGAPVAITAAMLVGLGFDPLYAAGICLIANTAPVAFGSIGIPITVASQVTSIPEMAISQMVGRTLPLLSLILPFYLIVLMCGIKKTREIFPAVFISGFSFALIQWACSNYLGPSLPDILAGIGSILCLIIFLKFWKPKNTWRFPHEAPQSIDKETKYSIAQIIRAWSPFIVLTIMIIAWGMQPIKDLFNSFGQVVFEFPGIHNAIMGADGKLIPHVFKFNYLSAAGTAIFISAAISIPLIGLSFKSGAKVFLATMKQLIFPIITITSILAFAYIMNDSGIILTIAQALAETGYFFPFFAPVLGWLGVFITGSDTSSNALFGKLQSATATSIGIDPVLTVAANTSGGVIGKMISPSSIAVAAAAGNFVGKESKLFRFTVKHSFILLVFTCFIVLAQTYLFDWIIPKYHLQTLNSTSITPDFSTSYIYLITLGIIIAAIAAIVIWSNRNKIKDSK